MMLATQAAIAAAALHLLRWHVLPVLMRLPQRSLILDVWGPIALVSPLVFTVAWVDYSVRGAGWTALGGPAICGLLAAAFSSWQLARHGEAEGARSPMIPFVSVVLLIAGAIFLLLGAVHVMHILIGQVAFAIVAVVLWINTPDTPLRKGDVHDHPRAWSAMFLIVLCACAMGVAAALVPGSLQKISAAILLVYVGISLALTAMYAGGAACVRLGMWAAAMGVLGATGGLSIRHMLPQAFRFIMNAEPSDIRLVAHGFGAYALEATLVLVLPLGLYLVTGFSPTGRRLAGAVFLAAALVIASYRLLTW